jgi:hypothetical protein
MLADLTPLEKLYNKGVDITAGVIISTISAGIVAVIAIIFWNWKKRRDLRFEADKLRLQHSFTEEAGAESRRQAARERRDRLGRERDIFAAQATQMTSGIQLAELVERYYRWLESSNIDHLPRNLKTLSENPHWAQGLRGATIPNIRLMGAEVDKLIRETELPEAE